MHIVQDFYLMATFPFLFDIIVIVESIPFLKMDRAVRLVAHYGRQSSCTGFIATIDLFPKEKPWYPFMHPLSFVKPVFRYGFDFKPLLRSFRDPGLVNIILKVAASLEFDETAG